MRASLSLLLVLCVLVLHSTYCFARKQPLLHKALETSSTCDCDCDWHCECDWLGTIIKTEDELCCRRQRAARKAEKRLIYNVNCDCDSSWAAGAVLAHCLHTSPHAHIHASICICTYIVIASFSPTLCFWFGFLHLNELKIVKLKQVPQAAATSTSTPAEVIGYRCVWRKV